MTNLLSIFLLFVVQKIIIDISIGHCDSNVFFWKQQSCKTKVVILLVKGEHPDPIRLPKNSSMLFKRYNGDADSHQTTEAKHCRGLWLFLGVQLTQDIRAQGSLVFHIKSLLSKTVQIYFFQKHFITLWVICV